MKFSSFNELSYDEGYLSQTPDEPLESTNDVSGVVHEDPFPYASIEHQDKFLEQRNILDEAAFQVLFEHPEIAQVIGVSKIIEDYTLLNDPKISFKGLGVTALSQSDMLPENVRKNFIHNIGVEFYDRLEEADKAKVVSSVSPETENSGSFSQTDYSEQEDPKSSTPNIEPSPDKPTQNGDPYNTRGEVTSNSANEEREEKLQNSPDEENHTRPDQAAELQGVPKFDDRSSIKAEKEDPERTKNTVSSFGTVEELAKAAKAHQIKLNGGKDLYEDWIVRPANWPNFIEFPSPRQKRAIDFANSQSGGVLPEETIKKFNESFQDYADQMQDRAKQMDGYICDFNKKYFKYNLHAFNTSRVYMGSFGGKPAEYRDFYKVQKKRADLEKIESEKDPAVRERLEYFKTVQRDAFQDVKWAILLNPTKGPDDPLFKQVAQWGHGVAVTRDGGRLAATEKSIFVPGWGLGTKQAGALAVAEAFERGWETIDISGTEEFIEGAKEALAAYGMGGKLVTQSGLLGRKTEFIMPDPPAYFKALEKTPATDQELNSDIGKVPSRGEEEVEMDLVDDEPVKIDDLEGEKENPEKNQVSTDIIKSTSLSRPGLSVKDLREAVDPFPDAVRDPENDPKKNRDNDFEYA